MLIFDKGSKGRHGSYLPECDVPEVSLPDAEKRILPLDFPELSENDVSRHYSELARKAHGVNDGFYPLGSCTMKYNPKIDDDMHLWRAFPVFIRFPRKKILRAAWN